MENIKLYVNEPNIVAGITLKDPKRPEANNMAFHTAKKATNVIENRSQLAKAIRRPLSSFVCAQQTHSANVYKVTEKDRGRGAFDEKTAIPQTDALYTNESQIVLCTFTADCVPVFFYNETKNIIGIIHSGWSGTVQEITRKTLQYVIETENCYITDFTFQIGTALSKKRFEVDTDVFILFEQLGYATPFIRYHEATNKYHIDNQQVIKEQCLRLGVLEEQITIDKTCTYDSPTGFSYREDRQAGRHLGFIFQK